MKKLLMLGTVLALAGCNAAHAGAWGEGYLDTYNWSGIKGNTPTLNAGTKGSYTFGVQGGLYDEHIDAYGFYEQSSLDDSFLKVTNHLSFANLPFTLYTQLSNYESDFGSETKGLAGIGTKINLGAFSFKPFAGYTLVDSDFGVDNSPMVGWSASYAPKDSGFMLTSWNESEVKSGNVNANGSLGIFTDISKNWYTGVQYRYFYNCGGAKGYADAIIFRLGYKL